MNLNGVLLVNKPQGMTSHDVVAFLRRRLQMKEIGHAGTLDPMAEGLLICLLGEGTKISDFLLNERKAYRAKVRFGIRTDTMDMEGQILEERPVHIERSQLEEAITKMVGDFEWPVPIFSAVKKDGKKMYEHARAGETVELPVRTMSFDAVELKSFDAPFCEVELECSKGSFIRTWADQLGQRMGVPTTLAGLRRQRSEPYNLDDAISLSDIETKENAEIAASGAFIPFEVCLAGLKGLTLRGKELRLILNGQVPHDVERRMVPDQRQLNETGGESFIRVLDGDSGHLVALLQMTSKSPMKLRRVFKRP